MGPVSPRPSPQGGASLLPCWVSLQLPMCVFVYPSLINLIEYDWHAGGRQTTKYSPLIVVEHPLKFMIPTNPKVKLWKCLLLRRPPGTGVVLEGSKVEGVGPKCLEDGRLSSACMLVFSYPSWLTAYTMYIHQRDSMANLAYNTCKAAWYKMIIARTDRAITTSR